MGEYADGHGFNRLYGVHLTSFGITLSTAFNHARNVYNVNASVKFVIEGLAYIIQDD